ncbi:MAG: zonular occludens toxin domain-containing protein [Agathobacter sp.]
MFKQGFMIAWQIMKIIGIMLFPVAVFLAVFALLCVSWFLVFKYYFKLEIKPSGVVPIEKRPVLKQIFYDVPRRYIMDMYEREPGFFHPRGIHMFCGEQGAGKTIACVEMMLRLQKQYPAAKMITNFGVTTENDELSKWQQLLDYTNGHKGVIVGIDEIQNWFMSGKNQLPEGMLEVATQNRKNNRILCCTAQVFTRVNKGLREQVTMVYNPHTFLGCFTVVVKRKPVFDAEGNVIDSKYRGMYSFVHTEELRQAYDTYKVIHTLSKEGFKDSSTTTVTNVYVETSGKRR